jgi:hypothetical protein
MAILAHFWHHSSIWRSESLNRNASTLGILSNHEEAYRTLTLILPAVAEKAGTM